MDISTLLSNLREEVSCSVCSTIFKNPKHLPCLHSFCLKCLQDWHKTSGSEKTIRCPNCQEVSRVPASGDVRDLPTSFYLNGLIDVLAIKECNSSEVSCGNCDQKSSQAFYCFQCCLFWCQGCKTGHDVIRSNREHRVLAIKEFEDKDYEDVLKRPLFCQKPRHKEKKLEFFCTECQATLCQTCVTLGHVGHALVLVEEEAEKLKPVVKNMIESQRQSLEIKMSAMSQLDEDLAKLLQDSDDITKTIQRFADSLVSVIEVKKQSALQFLENHTKKGVDSITEQKTNMANQIKVMQSSLEKADKLFAYSRDSEIIQLKSSLDNIFEGGDHTQAPDMDSKDRLLTTFLGNQKMFETVNSYEIGSFRVPHETEASHSTAKGAGLEEARIGCEATFVVITRNLSGRQCYNHNDHVTVSMIGVEGQTEPKMKATINNCNKNGRYDVSYFPRDQGKWKLSVKVNAKHIYGSPFEVQVKPFELRKISSWRVLFDNAHLWGVAVNDYDEMALTDSRNNSAYIYSTSGDYLRSFGSGILRFPAGIAYGKNSDIFVADDCKIKIFNREGKYLREFGGSGSFDSHLNRVLGLSVDNDGNVIVADAGNQLIKIFSPEGKFLMKIGQHSSFSQPWHCIRYNTYLIVADNGEDCVKVFDISGSFLYKIGERGHGPGQFCRPEYLSVNKFGQLLVCDAVNNRIQVFELNGNLVGMHYCKVKKKCVRPDSLTVLKSGQIVVVSDNTCIQFLE